MNGKIVIAITCSFIITITLLIILANSLPHTTIENIEHPFFSKSLELNKKQIFIFGSSQIAVINSALISNEISQKLPGYEFYNLAIAGDNPERRMSLIPKTILLNPTIVFYEISYRDFISDMTIFQNNNDSLIYQIDYNIILNVIDPENKLKLKNINPGFVTLRVFYSIMEKIGIQSNNTEPVKYDQNMPLYPSNSIQTHIANNDELERLANAMHVSELYIQKPDLNKNKLYLEKIINELQKKDIKVVLFIAPSPYEYNSQLSKQTKNNFELILKEIETNLDVKIYDFSDKYEKLPIWHDLMHVAINPESQIYTEDIIDMIFLEIEK